jgi:hypothetical protein
VWSTNDTLFNVKSLAITTPILAIATYVAVSNLQNLANLFLYIHKLVSDKIIKWMKSDKDEKWTNCAKAFEKFSPPPDADEKEHKPSDWRLLQYILTRLFSPSIIVPRLKRWIFKQKDRFRREKTPKLPIAIQPEAQKNLPPSSQPVSVSQSIPKSNKIESPSVAVPKVSIKATTSVNINLNPTVQQPLDTPKPLTELQPLESAKPTRCTAEI